MKIRNMAALGLFLFFTVSAVSAYTAPKDNKDIKQDGHYDAVMGFVPGNISSVPENPSASARRPAIKPASPPGGAAVSVQFSQDEDSLRAGIVAAAMSYQGARYVYGAMSPPGQFDCSGFIGQAYKDAAGYTIPRSSREIYRVGRAITEQELKPGDIVVFATTRGGPSHVALWINNSTIIQAVSSGWPTGVITSSMPDKYWTPRIIGYRTFFSNGVLISRSESPAAILPVNDFSIGSTNLTNFIQRGAGDFEAALNTAARSSVYNKTSGTDTLTPYFHKTGTGGAGGEQRQFQLKAKEKFESELLIFEETDSYKLEIRGNTLDLYFEHT
jgi:cell wall-associated NlpC family hydrolase